MGERCASLTTSFIELLKNFSQTFSTLASSYQQSNFGPRGSFLNNQLLIIVFFIKLYRKGIFSIEATYYFFCLQNQAAKIENAANRNAEREQKLAEAGVDQKQHSISVIPGSMETGIAGGGGSVSHFVSSFQVL